MKAILILLAILVIATLALSFFDNNIEIVQRTVSTLLISLFIAVLNIVINKEDKRKKLGFKTIQEQKKLHKMRALANRAPKSCKNITVIIDCQYIIYVIHLKNITL